MLSTSVKGAAVGAAIGAIVASSAEMFRRYFPEDDLQSKFEGVDGLTLIDRKETLQLCPALEPMLNSLGELRPLVVGKDATCRMAWQTMLTLADELARLYMILERPANEQDSGISACPAILQIKIHRCAKDIEKQIEVLYQAAVRRGNTAAVLDGYAAEREAVVGHLDDLVANMMQDHERYAAAARS